MPAVPIQFYNRLTQRLETEAVYGEGPLRFVYENPLGKIALHGLVKRALFSDWYGRQMDAPKSMERIRPFITQYGVNEAEFAEPVESYGSFNDFFYRKLKPEARPVVAEAGAVALPADGRHFVIPDVTLGPDFFVKGIRFNLPALLGDAALASKYEGGSVLISRLCPTDYHRFHFPWAGTPDTPRLINGPLYSVSPIAFMKRPSLFWENKRYVTRLETQDLGTVMLLEVGATCVGTVVHTALPDKPVRKGDEKGYFRFGGSCFITIFEKGRVRFCDDLVENSALGREVYARVGDVAAQRL
ncbi:phosphatidylserine decarboxylase [Prosthecobacter fusiformis]|nr:phosphatidylserine decarboxylase [Prosthecobacter fusiformis]